MLFAVVNLRPLFFADKPEAIILIKEELVEPVPAQASNLPTDQANSVGAVGAAGIVAPVTTTTATAPTTAVPPSSVMPVSGSDIALSCPAEDVLVSYKPEVARKSGDMVYVQVKSKQVVCVVDGSGKTQNKVLESGMGTSFYGKPPFKVLTGGLAQVDVYFQGYKARIENPNSKTLVLEASEVVTLPPADSTDSRLR